MFSAPIHNSFDSLIIRFPFSILICFQLKSEYDDAMIKVEGALQVALAEIKSCMKQLDEQSTVRCGLERKNRELERQLAVERQRNKQAEESKSNRKQWQEETSKIISSLQEECNSVFLRKIRDPSNKHSPRTVVVLDGEGDDFQREIDDSTPPGVVANNLSQFIPTQDRDRKYSSHSSDSQYLLQSPTQVNKTLDETEALVQSLLGDD